MSGASSSGRLAHIATKQGRLRPRCYKGFAPLRGSWSSPRAPRAPRSTRGRTGQARGALVRTLHYPALSFRSAQGKGRKRTWTQTKQRHDGGTLRRRHLGQQPACALRPACGLVRTQEKEKLKAALLKEVPKEKERDKENEKDGNKDGDGKEAAQLFTRCTLSFSATEQLCPGGQKRHALDFRVRGSTAQRRLSSSLVLRRCPISGVAHQLPGWCIETQAEAGHLCLLTSFFWAWQASAGKL